MNKACFTGVIKDIKFSHVSGALMFDKANLIVPRQDKNIAEDIITLKFLHENNVFHEGDNITVIGNLRTRNTLDETGKNHCETYVLTDFQDISENAINNVTLDGRICKINPLYCKGNFKTVEFILANNIYIDNAKINSYIFCSVKNDLAEQVATMHVSDKIEVTGKLHSYIYKTYVDDENYVYNVSHKLYVETIKELT